MVSYSWLNVIEFHNVLELIDGPQMSSYKFA